MDLSIKMVYGVYVSPQKMVFAGEDKQILGVVAWGIHKQGDLFLP